MSDAESTSPNAEDGHDYLSTACRHHLHHECRQTCKFCGAPCMCACHRAHESEPC